MSPDSHAHSVHPRGRGEQEAPSMEKSIRSGSSPRTRGTVSGVTVRTDMRRFIPADAGNRKPLPSMFGTTSVHPRGRGEQLPPHSFGQLHARFIPADAGNSQGRNSPLLPVRGSSPRTRGTVVHRSPTPVVRRFIPADAGNSESRRGHRAPFSVHPRGRGEQVGRSQADETTCGSSPRTRGTGTSRTTRRGMTRFIPADAGNSSSRGSN